MKKTQNGFARLKLKIVVSHHFTLTYLFNPFMKNRRSYFTRYFSKRLLPTKEADSPEEQQPEPFQEKS